MTCPKCKKCRYFKIDVTFTGYVKVHYSKRYPDEFEVSDSEPGDSEWWGDSQVECMDCDWIGTMRELEEANDQEVTPDDPTKSK